MSTSHPSLSSADTAWLHMDRPTNLMVINSILLFGEQLRWDRFTEIVRTRLIEPHPRFRECVVEGRLATGPHWEPDPQFDLGRHLHRRGLAAPADESALQALAGDLASMPLDRDKPLWDMYLIDGPGTGCAVIVRMHHCIADGIALAEVLLSLTDSAEAGDRPPVEEMHTSSGESSGTLGSGTLGVARRLTDTLAREGLHTIVHPRHALELLDALTADTKAAAKLLLTPAEERGALKHDLGIARSLTWSRPVALTRIKKIAHAQDATVNDVLLAAVSGALRNYLIARDEEPREIRTLVPVNLRPLDRPVADELGNRFGLIYLTLPVDRPSPRERLSELKRRMDAIKRSPEGPVSYVMLEATGMTPAGIERYLIDFFTAKATAVMTNVPGPRHTVYLAGCPLRTVLVWAPTAGSVGMSVSIFSYDGRITIGLLVHSTLVPDPQAIVAGVHREVTAMTRLSSVAAPSAA